MCISRRQLVIALAVVATTCASACGALIDLTPTDPTELNPYSTISIPLSELISETEVDGVMVGEMLFTEFSYRRIGDMALASEIHVRGYQYYGEIGLSFNGIFADHVGGSTSDAALRYKAELDVPSQNVGNRLNGAGLYIGGAGAGDESLVAVDVSFPGTIDTLNAFYSTVGPGANSALSDSLILGTPVSTLTASIDVFASAPSSASLQARISVIDTLFTVAHHPPAIGDFNADGLVDGADLEKWHTSFGLDAMADADGDLDTDGADFLIWQRGRLEASDVAAVPEPATARLVYIAMAFTARRRWPR